MHTSPPPKQATDRWLKGYPSTVANYGHLLLEQLTDADHALVDALRPYFESAHLDAREYFHAVAGFDLHPDAGQPGSNACYPNCLPKAALRGLFGEVMAGMITEAFRDDFVGKHPWRIPIFLFRFHADVEHHLFDLARGGHARQVYGRHGSDFIGVTLDESGKVTRFIVGEAKWRKTLSKAVVKELMLGTWVTNATSGQRTRSGKGIWAAFNNAKTIPQGLRQLQTLLLQRDPNGHAAAILSLDEVLLLANPKPIPRTNLVLIAGNDTPTRDPQVPFIVWKTVPNEYTAPHDLQVVEMILNDGDLLIDGLYSSLWL